MARGPGFVERLQLTQPRAGAILGTMNHAQIKPDGTMELGTFNITGQADGSSITLVVHSPLPLVPSINMSGTVSAGGVTLNLPNGNAEIFTTSTTKDYQGAVQHLSDRALALRQKLQAQAARAAQARHRDDLDSWVNSLNRKLTHYASMVQSVKAQQQIAVFHRAHEQLLAHAKRDLDIEHTYRRDSYAASQVEYAISQLQYQLNSVDYPWLNMPDTGRARLKAFDVAIARSPCSTQPDLPHCAYQPAAILAYRAVRTLVAKRCDDVEAAMKNDVAAMGALVGQAQQYASG